MRMYGRENSEVVKATKAVSATRKTLKESTKNCSFSAVSGPSVMTRAVSAPEAMKVPRLIAELSSGANCRQPNSASSRPPIRGKANTQRISTSLFFQFFHVLQVQTVESLPDLEEEDAQDDHADQHVERDAQFHHQRHAIGGAGGGEKQAVFHGEEADYLRDRLAARDHHQERQQHAGQGDPQGAFSEGAGHLGNRCRQVEGE